MATSKAKVPCRSYDNVISQRNTQQDTRRNQLLCRLNIFPARMSTSRVGNPLLADFILVGRKLEKLGFAYNRGRVILIEPLEEIGSQK